VLKISTPLVQRSLHLSCFSTRALLLAVNIFAGAGRPETKDGTIATWVHAASVAVPAAGGQLEANDQRRCPC